MVAGRRSTRRQQRFPARATVRTSCSATVIDDPIRELLAAVEAQPFWDPSGQTVIQQEKVIEAGADPVLVRPSSVRPAGVRLA